MEEGNFLASWRNASFSRRKLAGFEIRSATGSNKVGFLALSYQLMKREKKQASETLHFEEKRLEKSALSKIPSNYYTVT
jgi:hypothetical protein